MAREFLESEEVGKHTASLDNDGRHKHLPKSFRSSLDNEGWMDLTTRLWFAGST